MLDAIPIVDAVGELVRTESGSLLGRKCSKVRDSCLLHFSPVATCTFRICSWTNSEPGCARSRRSVFLWLAIDPLTKIILVTRARSSYPKDGSCAHPFFATVPGLLSVSHSLAVMGSISISMRLAAHFGHWYQVHRRGCKVLRWQVAMGLIYGQVKTC